jgi:peptidoglycan/xylan/chitin deacetylase (PgdA/CDA1 family)
MTRKQLQARRAKHRRIQRIRQAVKIGIYALMAIGVFCLVWFVVRPLVAKGGSGTEDADTSAVTAEAAGTDAVTGDTAQKEALTDTVSGTVGWNVDESGWWYKNEDGTKYVNGWKTIDGNKYFFWATGYIATGWCYVDDQTYAYFDQSGVCHPDAQPKLIALTFDDGPSWDTDSILDTLTAYHAKATFFVVGKSIEQDSKTKAALQREYDLGMEIGSHTYDHTILSSSTAEVIQSVMQKNDDLIQSLIGFTPTIMRPTGGGVNDTVTATVTKPMILWNVDTLDWKTKDASQTIPAATTNIKDGSVILMHDIYIQTADVVKTIVPTLQTMGYKMVTISELAAARGVTLEVGQKYYDFYPSSTESSGAADSFQTIDDSLPSA